MSRRTAAALFVLSLLALPGQPVPRPAEDPLHLVVLHTNDVHGQVLPRRATWLDREDPPPIGGLPRIAARVARVRREEPDARVVVVDAGDWYQGTPEGLVDTGLAFVRALSGVGYDAACIGNHELDHGLANLRRLVGEGGMPSVCANVFDASGEVPSWIEPWRVVEKDGLRIGFVGLLTQTTPDITHADARALEFGDPVEAVRRARAALEGEVDLLVPVGHVGVDVGRAIARAFPDLPLVVTGHSHRFLRGGEREGSTLIVQAGAKGTALGRVDLWVEERSGRVVRSEARLIDLLEEPLESDRVPAVERACRALEREASALMDEVVGELEAAPKRGRGLRSTVAGNWICDLMRAITGADVACHNRGGTRTDLRAGPVTRRDLFELLPFDNTIVTLTLTGAELRELVEQSIEGRGHTPLDFSGLVVEALAESEAARVVSIEVAGEPLDEDRSYSVSTNSFLAGGGDKYEVLARGRARRDEPLILRELVARELARAGSMRPSDEARIRVRGGER